ncbi:MAG: 3-phosphoshikimate 1-carboxyvinyltransferase [Candidatus Dormibacteraeota bacterium]|nr:3-phosphoshikimate 1-carboxyvinyltransferase [Candidatus Dormibacteraeota bacterium]
MPDTYTVTSPARLEGSLELAGDKSISHRALIFNAVAAGPARLENLATGRDVESTANCLRALGVEVDADGVRGVALHGLREPHAPLDCGNSGTTMRLLAGLLAGQPFESTLVGDESLSSRPMERVTQPLTRMGARVSLHPLRVGGGQLRGMVHEMDISSAQVKSALLLAGLQAEGLTRVIETVKTRDHSERMLAAMAAPIRVDGNAIEVRRADRLDPLSTRIPGDLSSAAYWIIAAAFHPRARIDLGEVGINPTRAGILRLMPVARLHELRRGGEPTATLHARTLRGLKAWPWTEKLSAEAIDELPVMAVGATQLSGTTVIAGAGELRVKESDRITAMTTALRAMGADIEERSDGWSITGPTRLQGAVVHSGGDHRVAMALGVAGLLAEGETVIEGADCVAISYPRFWDDLESLRG